METLPKGTIKELFHSRALALAIEEQERLDPSSIPQSIMTAYQRLKKVYEEQIEFGDVA